MRQVVITGIGIVSPLGTTAETSHSGFIASEKPTLKQIAEFEGTSLEDMRVAPAKEFNARERLGSRKMLKFMSEASVLGNVAAREALTDADVKQRFSPENIGLYAATGLAAADIREVKPVIEASINDDGEFDTRLFGERGLPKTNPLLSFKILANMPPCLVSIQEKIKGPNYIFTPWEGEAGAAILEGYHAVLNGEVDCAVVGGADAPTHPSTLVYLIQSGTVSQNDIAASAASYMVLESEESALRDNKRIYAKVSDVIMVNDAGKFNDPLVSKIGRTFAASAPLNIALAAMDDHSQTVTLTGQDGQTFKACVEVYK